MAVKIMDKENHARSNRVEVRSSDSFSCDGVEVKMGNHWYGARVVGRADDGFLVNYDYEKSSAPFFAPKNCVRRVSSPAAVEAAAKSLARFSSPGHEKTPRSSSARCGVRHDAVSTNGARVQPHGKAMWVQRAHLIHVLNLKFAAQHRACRTASRRCSGQKECICCGEIKSESRGPC